MSAARLGGAKDRDTVTSSVGGVSGGTGLVALATHIGANTPAGEILLYISPFATLVIGSMFYLAEIQANRYLQRRALKVARNTLAEQLDNPLTSDSHKARLRKKLEKLEEAWATTEIDRVTLTYVPQRQNE